jgi:hypothetical protein
MVSLKKRTLGFMIFILVLAIVGGVLIVGHINQPASPSLPGEEKSAEAERGLQIVLKDFGLPEVKYLQPTIKEIQLQNEGGEWITIWSSTEGKTLKLTTDGATVVLDKVSVKAGTYVGTRLMVSTIDVEADINRDGDTSDKNVQIIITEAEFNSLPPKEKPQAPGGASQGGQEPSPPFRKEGGYVYMDNYLDEKHTVTLNRYLVPLFESKFVYSGNGGKIIYDFTLQPLLPKEEQIVVNVSQQ